LFEELPLAQEKQKPSAIFRNSLASSISHWGRNARVLVATEGFWGIPMSWVFFYRPIFLNQVIGLSEVQIGFLSAVLAFSTIVLPLAGGYLADRFGRKRVFMLFDSTFWLSSLAVWIWTQNIWHALVAYLLEGSVSVIYSVWECILVEDTAPEYRSSIYGTISAIINIGALSTPIAGFIMGLYGVDVGTRTLFILAFASMIPMYAIRQTYLRETEFGQQIMKEKSFAGLKGYKDSLSMIRKNRIIFALLLTSILGSLYYASTTYMPLFLTHETGLGLSDELASLVPAATSTSALIIAALVVPKLASRTSYFKVLASGYGIGCLALLFFSLSPKGSLLSALFSGVILGVYTTTSYSVFRTFLTNEIEAANSRARAKILSLTVTLTSILGLPAPVLMGYLFSLDPRIPFMVVSAALAFSLMTLLAATKTQISTKQVST
jgi:DHA1 family tetracycline resistance protein-like MFS transporter